MKGCLSPFCFPKKKATVAVSKVSTLLHISAEPVEGKIKAILLPMYLLPLLQLVVGGMFSCDLDEVLKSLYLCVCVCICAEGRVEREDSSDLDVSFRGQNKQSPS